MQEADRRQGTNYDQGRHIYSFRKVKNRYKHQLSINLKAVLAKKLKEQPIFWY